MAEYTDDQIDAYGRQTKDSSYSGWDVTFNTDAAKAGRENIRKTLQQKAEQDAANAALNQEKAKALGMENQVSAEQLQQVYAELRGYQEAETGRGRTLQELNYAFLYGNFDGFNKMIKTDPIVAKAWKDKADKIESFDYTNNSHIAAYRRAGMPEEVLTALQEAGAKFAAGATEVVFQSTNTPTDTSKYTEADLAAMSQGTKYTKEDIKAIQMAYPIVYKDGNYLATTTQDFIAEAGLLRNIYSGEERNRMLSILDKGKTALQGIAQGAYASKLAKEEAEASKLRGEGVKAIGEGAETQSKADLNKINIDLIGKILEGEGTAEEKLAKFQDLTNPELAIKRQTAIAQQKKADVDLKTAEVGLTKAGLDIVKTGKEIEAKELDIQAGQVKVVEGEQKREAKVGDIDTAITLIDSLRAESKTLSKSAIVNWASGTLNPESSTYAFNKKLVTLKSKASLLNMEQIKGVLTDKDMEILQKAVGNLDIDQTKYSIQDQLSAYSKAFTEQARLAKQAKSKLDKSPTIKSNYQDPGYLEWKKSKGLK